MEHFGLKKQVQLFQNAVFIMGTCHYFQILTAFKRNNSGGHGAGLTNMLFASINTTIIEFPLRPHVDRCYGHMAHALGFDYWVVPQVSTFYHTTYIMDEEKADITLRLVRHLLQLKNQLGLVVESALHTRRARAEPLPISDPKPLQGSPSISIPQQKAHFAPQSRKSMSAKGLQARAFLSFSLLFHFL